MKKNTKDALIAFGLLVVMGSFIGVALIEAVEVIREVRARSIASEQIREGLLTGIIVGSDPWGNEYQFLETQSEGKVGRVMASAGQDGRWDTGDDIVGRKISDIP